MTDEPVQPVPTPAPPETGEAPRMAPQEAVAPPQPVSAPQQPVNHPPKPKAGLSQRTILAIAGILTLGITIFGILYLKSAMPEKEEPIIPVTPTAVPTPTPPPNLSRISSSSAFLEFGAQVASFAAVLNAFTLQDASLTPPILDADLNLQ